MGDKSLPVVYLLDGEDEFGHARFISEIEKKVGDPGMATLNSLRLDGRFTNLEAVREAALAIPFMVKRRLVVVDHPLAMLHTDEDRPKWLEFLGQVPESTALVLVEYHTLTDRREREQGRPHWLEAWGNQPDARCLVVHHPLVKDREMVEWIVRQAQVVGGQVSRAAAERLSTLVAEDTRLADQEIRKLLAFVNFARPVETDDVNLLTPYAEKPGDFALVNALRNSDAKRSLQALRQMAADQDPAMIFFSIANQFRQIVLARDVIDYQGDVQEAVKALAPFRISAYPARLAYEQASKFTTEELEMIYRKIAALDDQIKTGQIEVGTALEMLIVSLTTPPSGY